MSECFDPRECRVALLAGGKSGEREISLASGEGASQALKEAGFNVTVLDPAEKEDLKRLIDEPFDVAFLCLHGKLGEDGTVQGFLEVIGLPYIGSGVWSSALAMDKAKAKLYYQQHDIPTPPSVAVRAGDSVDAHRVIALLGDHCVVKPGTEGSALGVFIVEGEQAILDAVEKALEIDDEVLIERYIKGTELTVAVIGGNDLQALPIIEIVPKSDFYDFESKYAPGGSQHICPAPLSDETTNMVQELAIKAHKALGCDGVSRSDFILEEDGSCWILETNTIPGMTGTSLLPDAGRAAGISFPDLCTKLVQYALRV
ncbi:D-alanine--D-alanine ligase family protein [Paraeggerthella hongkongensis]|uniref:D-alanine--D-alanine ligase n=1 Tax=Paraeggerthella hongkongensis TaxID=230658 RepID=A0A3N0BGN2_9ACTN|nr:D-alanine--D-alanine ligase [Paraeggerthella hongkongensis]RNL47122.1 D-alanine--D-alanine ligase [Paraeggerthella hongkongensis]